MAVHRTKLSSVMFLLTFTCFLFLSGAIAASPSTPPSKPPPSKPLDIKFDNAPASVSTCEGCVDISKLPKDELLFANDKALLQSQQEKEEEAQNATLLESVSGGYWENVPYSINDVMDQNKDGGLVSKRSASTWLRACLKKGAVPVSYKGDHGFNIMSSAYNQRLAYVPDVYILASRPEHVMHAVACAKVDGIRVQAKAGGHSYGSFSTGGRDGSMIIDLRRIEYINYDRKTKFVVAGAGVRLGNLALALANEGRAISHGDCPSVGLAGHALHGGFGYTSRKWGLSTDFITGLDVILENGQFVQTSSRAHPDLFWALKGAADSFGIVVNIHLDTERMPEVVTHFSYDMSADFGNPERMAKQFISIQNSIVPKLDENIGFTIRVAHNSYRVAGYYSGSASAFNKNLHPVFNGALNGYLSNMQEMSFKQSLAMIAGATPLRQTQDNPTKSNFFAKSLLASEDPRLKVNLKTMTAYFAYVMKETKYFKGQYVLTFRLMGGPNSNVYRHGTSACIGHRKALWIIQHDGVTSSSNRKDVMSFIEGVSAAITSIHPGWPVPGSSRNYWPSFLPFLDPSLSDSEAHEAYFEAWDYQKLKKLKAKWDPKEVFSNPQSVRPAK